MSLDQKTNNFNMSNKRPRSFLKEYPPSFLLDASGEATKGATNQGNDDGDDDDDDAYEWSEQGWFQSHGQRRRPYPSSSQMIFKLKSSAREKQKEKKRSLPPILQDFLTSIGRVPDATKNFAESGTQSESITKETEDSNKETKTIQLALEDPSRSTLTAGQHERYISFLTSGKAWKTHERKEFGNLKQLVQQEQARYRQEQLNFWSQHKEDRIMVGFSPPKSPLAVAATKFVSLAAFPESIKEAWIKEYSGKIYGRCCQIISLETVGGITTGNKNRWTVDAIASQTVGITTTAATNSSTNTTIEASRMTVFPDPGTPVPIPKQPLPVNFLEHDKAAVTLAKEHRIPMIATLDAVEAIMSTDSSPWSQQIRFSNGVAIMDLPLPHPDPTPRACLTRGLNDGLAQWACRNFKDSDSSSDVETTAPNHRYVVLTLPQPSSLTTTASAATPQTTKAQKQIKVLVRVPAHYSTTRVHAHVEYFPERGEETISAYERSLWILDHFLKMERSLVARIDPSKSCQVLRWEPTSMAHALAGIEGTFAKGMLSQQDPMDHWHRLAKLLQAIPTLSRSDGNFLLCYPGRSSSKDQQLMPQSVSVHMETTTTTTLNIEDGSIIRVETELQRAGEVQLGPAAISRTMQDWKWMHKDRAPYTFPVESTNKSVRK